VSGDELALFRDVPGNNVALFGGNYMKMQNFMSSTIGKAMSASMKDEKSEAWMTCFINFKDMKIAGGVSTAGKDVTLRIAFSGLKLSDIEACAKKGEFKTTMDPDNKFLSVDVQAAGMTVTQGYLQLPDGKIYSRTGMELGMAPSFASAPRADLEADVAASTKASAADDTKLTGLLAKVDRSKTFWFAGNAAGTPIADKVGEMFGSVDLDSGMAIDVTVQLADAKMADKIEEGIDQAKKMADQMPGDLKGIITGLEFSRDGDHVRLADKISESQLKSLMSMGAMGGLGGRKHHSME
jgi:hypothetical protein